MSDVKTEIMRAVEEAMVRFDREKESRRTLEVEKEKEEERKRLSQLMEDMPRLIREAAEAGERGVCVLLSINDHSRILFGEESIQVIVEMVLAVECMCYRCNSPSGDKDEKMFIYWR